jgi:hypothetical protein
VLLYTIVQMIDYLISVVSMVVIVQFVMGLLISFNVINTSNNAVIAIWFTVGGTKDIIGLFRALKNSKFDDKDDGRAEHLSASGPSSH